MANIVLLYQHTQRDPVCFGAYFYRVDEKKWR